jgi:hypothetical protein
MLIQKTFHLGMKGEIARGKLLNLREYRNELVDVEQATVDAEGVAHFDFHLSYGLRGKVDLVRAPGDNPAQLLFRSRGGNLDVLGVLECFEIKPDLTEIVLTLDYSFISPVARLVDYLSRSMERFIDEQLERIETHFARPITGMRADSTLPAPINGNPRYHEEED